ncbi:MAG: hypothetical protein RDV48_00540 [Candidatus Eremiobacteraeota bacterium]|nr:hypothetical protein [Candidatus Eremiobacteraeota bacterium]
MISENRPAGSLHGTPPLHKAGSHKCGEPSSAAASLPGDTFERSPGKASSGVTASRPSPAGSGKELSPALKRLVKAADSDPFILVPGNGPEGFSLKAPSEVDPGSQASEGLDARGNAIWAVDQKCTYRDVQGQLDTLLLDGIFCGGSAGKTNNGPTAAILAVEREGRWEEIPRHDHTAAGAKKSPFQDPSITRVIVKMDGVKPLQSLGAVLPAGTFEAVVDTRQTIHGENKSELTLHFLNPDKRSGPFPGTTEGAVRFRASRNADDSVTIEGYYVTRAAREYIDHLTDFVPLAKTGKSLFSLGRSLYRLTPMGFITSPLSDALGRTMEGITDKAIGTLGFTRPAVAALHSSYYRTVLFPNLLGK